MERDGASPWIMGKLPSAFLVAFQAEWWPYHRLSAQPVALEVPGRFFHSRMCALSRLQLSTLCRIEGFFLTELRSKSWTACF